MSKIGLFFGPQTGKTESLAEMIRDEFGDGAVDYRLTITIDSSPFFRY